MPCLRATSRCCLLLRYASVSAARIELKTIAPPEFADSADADICYTYEVNLKNGLFAADELVFLQLEDEEYYFKILPAGDDWRYSGRLAKHAARQDGGEHEWRSCGRDGNRQCGK